MRGPALPPSRGRVNRDCADGRTDRQTDDRRTRSTRQFDYVTIFNCASSSASTTSPSSSSPDLHSYGRCT